VEGERKKKKLISKKDKTEIVPNLNEGVIMKHYKVPFRKCYTPGLIKVIKWTVWCHVVLRIWPEAYSPKV